MDRTTHGGVKWETLERIVALLLALAHLAERSAAAPRPVRVLLLWALRRADAVARELVADVADPALDDPLLTAAPHGCDPLDALALAWSLRMLALTIGIMAVQLRHQAFLQGGHAPGRSLSQRPWPRLPDISDRPGLAALGLDSS